MSLYKKLEELSPEALADLERDCKIDAVDERRRELAEDREKFDFERDQGAQE